MTEDDRLFMARVWSQKLTLRLKALLGGRQVGLQFAAVIGNYEPGSREPACSLGCKTTFCAQGFSKVLSPLVEMSLLSSWPVSRDWERWKDSS